MIKAPQELKYAATHEWVRLEADGTAQVGITDLAQDALGDIVFVEFPKVGQILKAGEACGVVESVKAASDVYAPLSGVVVAVNETLPDAWERINRDAFGAWLFKVKPANLAELDALLDAGRYAATAEVAK